jgi:hypothetical protein
MDDLPTTDATAARDRHDIRPLPARIVDTPHLARLVPHLHAEVVHRMIDRYGLDACGELVTLTTPEQLANILDLDLWRRPSPGLDEQFDVTRFATWLEVLVESGAEIAARIVAGIDTSLLVGGLARHVRVFDPAAVAPIEIDGEPFPMRPDAGSELSREIGGYLVVARRDEAWDAIVEVLASLDADHPEIFHDVMRGCRALSNSAPEVDGIDDLLLDAEQVAFDLEIDREQRRHGQGYATPAEARAFLHMSRQLSLDAPDPPVRNPIAASYFRILDETAAADIGDAAETTVMQLPGDADPHPASAAASLLDVLVEEGVIAPPVRGLLAAAETTVSPFPLMETQLRWAHDHDAAAYAQRTRELAFLANTILVGCAIQARAFTEQEASDAAVAICNLGLENWPVSWLDRSATDANAVLPVNFLVDRDLVGVFQVGWSVLYRRVCLAAADALSATLDTFRSINRETQRGLDQLAVRLLKDRQAGEPWLAHDELEILSTVDLPVWAAMLCFIDQCPVLHASVRAVLGARVRAFAPSAFEFIASNAQIAVARDFLDRLPEFLRE